MAKHTSKNDFGGKNNLGCYCPKCKVYIDKIHLEGLSMICPFCGCII